MMNLPSILKPSSFTDPAASCSANNKNKMNVRFDCLIIKEFPIELGHSNVPSAGAPVSMSQTACRSFVINMEHFESIRPPRRRRKNAMILTTAARTELLLLAGHSFEEIANATLTARSIRVSRNEVILLQQHAASNNKQGGLSSKLGRVMKNMISLPINKNRRAVRCRLRNSSII
jgi:hypothetical protein